MSGFLYFKPQQTRNVSVEDVNAWGLAYAFDAQPASRGCHNNTPTGAAGVVFSDPKRHGGNDPKMEMELQVWEKMSRPEKPDIYVGYVKDSPPTPADLARRTLLSGFSLLMRDGNSWLCPLVRMLDAATEVLGSALPSRMVLDAEGNATAGDVVKEYAYLYDLMSEYAAHMQAGSLKEFFDGLSMSRLCKDAIQLMQANYVIDLPEASVLGLWHVNGDTCLQANVIVLSSIDYDTYSRWEQSSQKKTPSPVTADS